MEAYQTVNTIDSEAKQLQLFAVDRRVLSLYPKSPPGRLLLEITRGVCDSHQINYDSLTPLQRLFVTHYRCYFCGLLPLYVLDFTHMKLAKCTRCTHLVPFKKTGKYGSLRKEIASRLRENHSGVKSINRGTNVRIRLYT
jgi:hypothetical protein